MPRNDFITALQTQERPPAFQFAFGENTHNFAIVDFFRSGAHSRMRLALANRDATNRTENRMQDPVVVIFLADDVADRARAGELQDQRVHPTDMVWHQKKAAGRQVLKTERSDPIKGAHQWLAKEI